MQGLPMIFGYSTNAYTRFDLFTALEMIADIGFSGVEIMCDKPHLYPPEWAAENVDILKDTLSRLQLEVINLNSFTLYAVGDIILPSWIDDDPQQRSIRIEHTKSCLRMAQGLGCTNISIPPGGKAGVMPERDALALFRKGLEQVIPIAEETAVHLLIEPEPLLLIENSEQMRSFISAIKSDYVGVNFDIGHFFCAGENPAEAFEKLFPWVGHVHIEDIAADRTHNHLIPGLGAINFAEVFTMMTQLNYIGDISLELYPYTENPSAAGKEGHRHLLPMLEAVQLR
jgi:sugar phosphate isomerase/epimerase